MKKKTTKKEITRLIRRTKTGDPIEPKNHLFLKPSQGGMEL